MITPGSPSYRQTSHGSRRGGRHSASFGLANPRQAKPDRVSMTKTQPAQCKKRGVRFRISRVFLRQPAPFTLRASGLDVFQTENLGLVVIRENLAVTAPVDHGVERLLGGFIGEEIFQFLL